MGFLTFITEHMALFWIIIAVIFAVVESFTVGLVTVWFTIGGIAAAVVSLAGGSPLVQTIVFFAVSIILLIFTRPILVRHLKVGKEKNAVESLEGKIALVTEQIGPHQSGLVKVNGIIWTAIGETPETEIAAGLEVHILSVEGVKLIVALPPQEN